MNMRMIAVLAVVLVVSAPAFAATQYYVAHKPNNKVCTVVTTKPDGKAMIMVGKTAYASTADAAAAMKAAADCK